MYKKNWIQMLSHCPEHDIKNGVLGQQKNKNMPIYNYILLVTHWLVMPLGNLLLRINYIALFVWC